MAIASSAYKKALEGSQQRKEVLVKIDRVSKQFDETLAVDNVSLNIHKGEIFALLAGPAPASRPCCGCWRGSSVPPRDACSSTGSTSPTCRPMNAPST